MLHDYLDFSNILSKTAIGRLADVDEYEVVREVQVCKHSRAFWLSSLMMGLKEYFADYAPVLPSLFSLNHTPTSTRQLYGASPSTWDPKALDRTVQGIIAVLLSLKKKPVIRYEKSSGMAKKLGVEIQVCPALAFFFFLRTGYVGLSEVVAPDSIRIFTLRLQGHASTSITPHSRSKKRSSDTITVSMDIPSHGARVARHSKWSC